jgi:hypothetical protein
MMLWRGGVVILAGALLAGCANNTQISTGFAPPAQAAQVTEPERDPSKKTLASKVLSAIALERVTGRKPDPARLTELN